MTSVHPIVPGDPMHLVLVHGAGGSPSTWSAVAPLLDVAGLTYTLADNPSQSLRDDESAVRALIDAVAGPVLLVGHSYGGAVITNAGTHPAARGLVYIAAFAPDRGETVSGIVGAHEPAPVAKYFRRGPAGEWIPSPDEDSWRELAWDVPKRVRLASQADRRISGDAIFTQETGEPAWASRPSWYLVASSDAHLLPGIQRKMATRMRATVDEVDTSHAVAHAAPGRVVEIIRQAVGALAVP